MTHPFLQDPEHLRAFQQLTAVPTGSVRKWEQLLGWKPGRLQRFLASLVKYELAEVESCRQHSVFHPRVSVAGRSGVMRSVAPPNQGQCSGLTASRFGKKPTEKQEGAELLIAAMNEVLVANHPDHYVPVQADNFGSHAAARRWLVDEKIPLEEAIVLLRRRAAGFNPSKINGDMPRSLGFFTKSLIAEWHRIQRDRQQLGLFPKLEMHVERVPEYKPPDVPAPTPEEIDRFAQDWRAIVNSPTPPRRA